MTDFVAGAVVLAHGLGARADLPISGTLAQIAAVVVLLLTFLLLSARWPVARFETVDESEEQPRTGLGRLGDSVTLRVVVRAVGVVAYLMFLVVLAFGAAGSDLNPAPTWFYVWFWVGLVPLSVALGPVWRWLNPLRAFSAGLAVVLRRLGVATRRYPERFDYWPAVLSLGAFLWLELVKDQPDMPATILVFVLIYTGVNVLGGAVYGPQWHARADGFEVYSTFLGHLSPVQRNSRRNVVLSSPFRHLARFPKSNGAVAVVCVLLGGTAFDGLTRTQWWNDLTQDADGLTPALLGTSGLVGSVAVIFVTYYAASYMSSPFVDSVDSRSTSGVARAFAHSLVPVVVGYTVAHYYSLVVFQGQAGFLLADDPLGKGWDWFGAGRGTIDYGLISTRSIAWIQVGAILLGHVIGVVAAHDRAVSAFRSGDQRRGQYPLIAVMILYTFAGIGLLVGA